MEDLKLETCNPDEMAVAGKGAPPRWDWSQLPKGGGQAAVFEDEKEFRAAKASLHRWTKQHGGRVVGRKCIDGKWRIWRM